ncbi:MAG: hypothetical protein EU551_03280 [Promethearchaeota archaeon]|nr:MAG: hypothetical protein EU551_03280 [Candidatus Lokiarchaeota archaeon]
MISINIEINRQAILKIAGSSSRYANFEIEKEDWKEGFGILIGIKKNFMLIIQDAIPLEHSLRKENDDIINAELLYINSISENLEDFEILGWFSSRYSGKNKDEIRVKEEDYIFHNKFRNLFPESVFLLFNQLLITNTMKQSMKSSEIYGFNIIDIQDDKIIEKNWKCKDDPHLVRVNMDDLMLDITEYLPRDNLKAKYMDMIERNRHNLFSQYENYIDFDDSGKKGTDLNMTKLRKSSQRMDLKNLCKSIKENIDRRLDLLDYIELKEQKIKDELKDYLMNLCLRVDDLQNTIQTEL